MTTEYAEQPLNTNLGANPISAEAEGIYYNEYKYDASSTLPFVHAAGYAIVGLTMAASSELDDAAKRQRYINEVTNVAVMLPGGGKMWGGMTIMSALVGVTILATMALFIFKGGLYLHDQYFFKELFLLLPIVIAGNVARFTYYDQISDTPPPFNVTLIGKLLATLPLAFGLYQQDPFYHYLVDLFDLSIARMLFGLVVAGFAVFFYYIVVYFSGIKPLLICLIFLSSVIRNRCKLSLSKGVFNGVTLNLTVGLIIVSGVLYGQSAEVARTSLTVSQIAILFGVQFYIVMLSWGLCNALVTKQVWRQYHGALWFGGSWLATAGILYWIVQNYILYTGTSIARFMYLLPVSMQMTIIGIVAGLALIPTLIYAVRSKYAKEQTLFATTVTLLNILIWSGMLIMVINAPIIERIRSVWF